MDGAGSRIFLRSFDLCIFVVNFDGTADVFVICGEFDASLSRVVEGILQIQVATGNWLRHIIRSRFLFVLVLPFHQTDGLAALLPIPFVAMVSASAKKMAEVSLSLDNRQAFILPP